MLQEASSALAPLRPSIAPEYISKKEASALTGTPVATLETLRSRGGGPRFVKRGTRVLYAVRDLRAWLEAGARFSTSEVPEAA